MRLKLIGLLVFIVLIYGCFSGNQPLALSQIIKQASSGQAILLDVRTQEEYEKIRAKGALHLSLSDLQSGKMPNIGRKKQVYTYCQSGVRSEKARKILVESGYISVGNIGGIGAWQKAGGQVESDSD